MPMTSPSICPLHSYLTPCFQHPPDAAQLSAHSAAWAYAALRSSATGDGMSAPTVAACAADRASVPAGAGWDADVGRCRSVCGPPMIGLVLDSCHNYLRCDSRQAADVHLSRQNAAIWALVAVGESRTASGLTSTSTDLGPCRHRWDATSAAADPALIHRRSDSCHTYLRLDSQQATSVRLSRPSQSPGCCNLGSRC